MRNPSDTPSWHLTRTSFAGDGEPNQVTGPDGTVTRWENDRLGRTVKLIENAPRNPHSSSDESSARVTQYHYAPDGGLSRLVVSNPDTGDQVTTWQYGTSIATDGVACTDLLKTKIYRLDVNAIGQVVRQTTYSYDCPSLRSRPAESLRMEHAAIAAKQCQGRVVTSKDANGTEHAYVLDKLDRITQDRVTALGTGIDEAVRRIAVEYTDRGLLGKVTSHNNATVGAGVIVNQVAFSYNAFNRLTEDAQSHSGAVTGSTPRVGYSYANGTGNTTRRLTITYPSGRICGVWQR